MRWLCLCGKTFFLLLDETCFSFSVMPLTMVMSIFATTPISFNSHKKSPSVYICIHFIFLSYTNVYKKSTKHLIMCKHSNGEINSTNFRVYPHYSHKKGCHFWQPTFGKTTSLHIIPSLTTVIKTIDFSLRYKSLNIPRKCCCPPNISYSCHICCQSL